MPTGLLRTTSENEAIDAVLPEAGASAFVFGGSSDGVLTQDAATHGLNITKPAIYEPPFVVDASSDPVLENIVDPLKHLIAFGRRGDGLRLS